MMDCPQDLEFHMPDENSGRALEKAKESILLMKKKMFRSHDLILQYNNKLKECERLKEDLALAQEEVTKFKRENNLNLTKVVKLEMQNANNKKLRQELEQKIAEMDIQIASDKSHLRQLECKLNAVEEINVEKEMEAELKCSSLEVKTKELEQELKALKKSHTTEVNKLERALKSPREKKAKKIIEVVKETREIGINTVEETIQPKLVKPTTANKIVSTDEFYHIRDNPYPIFCHRCKTLMKPKVEEICQIMTNPPIGSKMLSPIRSLETQILNANDTNNSDVNCLDTNTANLPHNEFLRPEMNLTDNTRRLELNFTEINRVDQPPQNFVSPSASQLSSNNSAPEFKATSSDTSVSELESLRRKIETLERKIKKRKTQKSSDSHASNFCNHQHPINCCGHSSTQVNPIPNVFPNVQADIMTEFFNKMMNVVNKRDLRQETTKITSRKNERDLRDKRLRNKCRKLKKLRMLRKKVSSKNWQVECDECDATNNTDNSFDPSDPTKPHLLRIKQSSARNSPVTLFSDTESEKLSPVKNSFVEKQTESPKNRENLSEAQNRIEIDSNQESPVKVPDKSRSRKRGRSVLSSDDGQSEMEVDFVKNEIIEENQNQTKIVRKNIAKCARTRSKSLRDDDNEGTSLSVKRVAIDQQNSADSFLQSTIKESNSLLSKSDAASLDSCGLWQNDEMNESSPLEFEGINKSTSIFDKYANGNSDVNPNNDSPEIHFNSESFECKNSTDRVETQRRQKSKSPKAIKSTGRSNLLGKLRALKKNSITTVSKTSNSPSIHTTRSLSRRRLTEQSDNDDLESLAKENNKRTPSISGEETNVPMKKQRIAHVPKKATDLQLDCQESTGNSKTSELIESSDESSKSNDEKTTQVGTTDIIKRPLTRRSTIEKSATNELINVRETIKTGKPGRPRLLSGTTTTGRRGRPPGKRNVASNPQISLDSKEKELATGESTENYVNAESDSEKQGKTPEKRDIEVKDLTKESENSPKKIQVPDNDEKNVESSENNKISDSITVETAKFAKDSILASKGEEESSTKLIHAAGDPINKKAAVRALQFDKPSAADSIASLEGILVKPAEISISPNRSAVSMSPTTIENKESNVNLPCTKFSNPIDPMDVSEPVVFSLDKENSEEPPKTVENIVQNVETLDESKNLSNDKTENKIITSVSEESPNPKENSPTNGNEISTFESMKSEERSSIYDNVAVSIPLEKTDNSLSMNGHDARVKNTKNWIKFVAQKDVPSDMPNEKPIERKLVVYDTNLHDDDFDVDCEEFDSMNNVKAQYFGETSVAGKQKIRSNSVDSNESINVVKELRSRQVLCSPPTSAKHHNNLPKIQNTSNDESKTVFPCDETLKSQPESHTGIRSLGTLLNHHLGEQKKKRAVKNTKFRRAAAIKLQEAAENSVKVELEKLVKCEEWTSEVHSKVLEKLTDVRSERTVAKSIINFLLERASLDEPLDRTYTPPAPIMTKTQQRIVTLINCLNRVKTMAHIFDLVQAGIQYSVFKRGQTQPVETVEYLFRIFTVIARLRKDRERVRIFCCDAFYFLGRRAIPAIHVILTVWPEVLPKHGTIASELPNCLAHLIKQEPLGKDPYPKILACKKMITRYYEYPQTQAVSAVVMTVLIKALQERYSSELEAAILIIAKREGSLWALENIIEKGLMKIIKDDSYQWQFEIINLLGFILRSFSTYDDDTLVKDFIILLCRMLDSGEGSQDKQEGIVAALLSLSRYRSQFGRISDSVLEWIPNRDLRATTLQQLELFFQSHTPEWWNTRLQYKIRQNSVASHKNN